MVFAGTEAWRGRGAGVAWGVAPGGMMCGMVGPPVPHLPSSDTYVFSRRRPLIAAVVLGVGMLALAWWIHDARAEGNLVAAPEDLGLVSTIAEVIAAAFGLIGVWAVVQIPFILKRRFVVDRAGLHHSTMSTTLDLPWSEVRAVRITVLSSVRPVTSLASLIAGRRMRTTARPRLELSFDSADDAERRRPTLRRMRARGGRDDGFTHLLRLEPGAFLPSDDPADYSPELQAVLRAVAGDRYQGARIRRTLTTYTS